MRAFAAVPLLALTLAGCGPKAVTLSDDPIDRAATCGVVAAAKARKTVNSIQGPLPFDMQLGVVHYAMLAGADEEGFSKEKASAGSKRMAELADKVTDGKWQKLEQPCAQAFPATAKAPTALSGSTSDQQLQCFTLVDFLRTALASSETSYSEQLTLLGDLRRGLDTKVGARFAAKGKTAAEDQKDPKNEALSEISRAGPPATMLKLCTAKFPPPKMKL